jgi:hypothetical protein
MAISLPLSTRTHIDQKLVDIQSWPHWNDIRLVAQKEYHMSPEEFHHLLPEYQRFMTLIALGYKHLGMSNEAIDHIWHSHILYSKRYRQFCISCIGFFVDHRPNLTGSPRLECDVPETPPAECVPEPPETPPAKCGVACDYDDDPRDELSTIPFAQAYMQAFGTYPSAIWGLSHDVL